MYISLVDYVKIQMVREVWEMIKKIVMEEVENWVAKKVAEETKNLET